ncbi:hypothetical protein ACEPAF_4643 [Sanghuangporus sanghuang]
MQPDTIPSPPSSDSDETAASRGQKRPLEGVVLASGRRRIPRFSAYPLYNRAGRHMARTEEPFDQAGGIINAAITRSNNELENRVVTITPAEQRRLDVFDRTLGCDPVIHEGIMTANPEQLIHIVDAIRQGQQLARSDDTILLKRLVTTWVKYKYGEKPPHLDRKHERGFNNRSIAELLRPVEVIPTEEYYARLRDGTATIMDEEEERLVSGADYRVLMYEGGQYSSVEPLRGFLKGQHLVKGYKAVFTCPSSADIEDPSLARSTKRGNAALNDMKRVTPSSIAYITIQVYFALSSRTVFSVTCAPEILEMYQSIMSFFNSDVPYIQRYAQELIEWWNEFFLLMPERSSAMEEAQSAVWRLSIEA